MFDIFLISRKNQTFRRAIPPSRLSPCHLPLHKGGVGLAPDLRKPDFFDSLTLTLRRESVEPKCCKR